LQLAEVIPPVIDGAIHRICHPIDASNGIKSQRHPDVAAHSAERGAVGRVVDSDVAAHAEDGDGGQEQDGCVHTPLIRLAGAIVNTFRSVHPARQRGINWETTPASSYP
jgi:hypothetical protein